MKNAALSLGKPTKMPLCQHLATAFLVFGFALQTIAATFSGNARIEVNDPASGLSWNAGNDALTVSCWFKLSIPSGTNLTENMTILVNRRSGSQSDAHAYLVQFNILTGNIEFSSRGNAGLYTNTLIERPYLERWYHVAIVRSSGTFNCYLDGRPVSGGGGSAGDASGGDGLSVGGWGNGKYLYGEVQEAAVYQTARDQEFVVNYLFLDQPTNDPSLNLQGYFKMGYSTNAADNLRNFALSSVPSASTAGSGTVLFEESNQGGEQSAFDSRKNGGRDALSPLSGGFSWNQTALSRPTPGIAFDFRYGYSSGNASGTYKLNNFDPYASGPLGKGGWRHTFETRILPSTAFSPLGDADTTGVLSWDGAIETWDKDLNTSEYKTRDSEYKGEFFFTPTNCQWITPERLIYVFKLPNSGSPSQMRGRLLSIRDFNSNAVQLQWNETSAVITQVVDTVRGAYSFKYSAAGLLTNVNFQNWSVNFGYDSSNRLTSKFLTNTTSLYANLNTTWQFQYGSNGLLARIVDPRGVTNLTVQYDQYGRQTNQSDALNRSTTTRYGIPGNRQITRRDAETNLWIETYDRKGHILAQQDPLTNITRFVYNANGNRITVTEPLEWQTTFGYDSRANVIARTNALGEVARWTYHSFFNKATSDVDPSGWTNFYTLDNNTGNLLTHQDGIGTLVSYTYRTNGLVDTSTDANGRVTRFDYNTNGFLISKIDPGTNLWTYVYNDVGWKLNEANPLGEVSAYSYNLNGNVVQAVDPLFRHFTKSYDASGNLLNESDGKNQLTTYAYDAANQRTNMVDRTGTNKWTYTYTLRGKPASTIDPQGNVVTQVYDAANRLIRATDPIGNSVSNLYDPNGNQTVLIDKLGQRWVKTFDRLNRVSAETDPQGNARQSTYDQNGRLKVVTTPNGYPSVNTYDGRGRLIKWVDAENFSWLYDYDGNANITNITDAMGGHYLMTYGPRNERLSELNQDTNQWAYTYDELLRLKQQTDPNGTTRSLDYDAGGRLLAVQFNTGRRNTLTYDDNNNPRTITRRVGTVSTTTQFNYDVLDRVTEETDTFQQTVRYGYDSLSRVTALTYPDGKVLTQQFDPLGRLTNSVDWSARQMNYTYDRVGRLLTRTYPNGIIQTNTFDNAGRITGLSYTPSTISSNSISVALTYAYDRNGNKTGIGERGTFNWPMPSLLDESSQFTPAGKLKSRVDVLNVTNNFTYKFDASGNMTNASGGGQSWRLTYDEDNRTTSIFWDWGMATKLITNRYDALGRRVARTLDGVETRYVLDLQGSMERILCDSDAAGNLTAWYVHGPDLCYKVNATNGLTCYHADAQANIIALTDGSTNLVAQYAYTPYGRSLGSTNLQVSGFSPQPFLFVGSQGVMEELPGLYFMRARYYSADAGVFLSTDPVKNVGPGWKPIAYDYVGRNPVGAVDPTGLFQWYGNYGGPGWTGGREATYENLTEWENAGRAGLLPAPIDAEDRLFFQHDYQYVLARTANDPNIAKSADRELGASLLKLAEDNIALGRTLSDRAERQALGVAIQRQQNAGIYFSATPIHSFDVKMTTIPSITYGSTPAAVIRAPGQLPGNQIISSASTIAGAKQASATTEVAKINPSSATGGGTGNASSPTTTYTVKAGDTLGNIGYANGTTATAIGAANGIQNLNQIRPGQVLTIPRGSSSRR